MLRFRHRLLLIQQMQRLRQVVVERSVVSFFDSVVGLFPKWLELVTMSDVDRNTRCFSTRVRPHWVLLPPRCLASTHLDSCASVLAEEEHLPENLEVLTLQFDVIHVLRSSFKFIDGNVHVLPGWRYIVS